MIPFIFMLATIGFLAIHSPAHAGELDVVLNIVAPFLIEYAEKYPLLGSILRVMVLSRLVMKPLMSALLEINKTANFKFLDPVRELSDSKIYKTVAFVLDWLLSIKLPKKPESK